MSSVTARGVIDGDHAALEGLCAARGRPVLAYSEAVCGPAASLGAAAHAFATFRIAAVTAPDPLTLDPDPLLLSKTRHAAAACVHVPARRRPSLCAEVPGLLAHAADGTLDQRDRERLRRHLARCSSCRDLEREQKAAEIAYRRPHAQPLSAIEGAVILAALTAAAPVVESPPPPPPRLEPEPEPEPELPEFADYAFEPEFEPLPVSDSPVRTGIARGATLRQRERVGRIHDRRHHHRGGFATRVLAPSTVLVMAVVAVLAVAGVFGGSRAHHPNVVSLPGLRGVPSSPSPSATAGPTP